MRTLDRAILGDRSHRPEAQFPGLYDAEVWDAGGSTLTFTIPAYDRRHVFGPAPYQHDHATAVASSHAHQDSPTPVPARGTPCVVAFVGPGIDKPRVLAIYGWPS